MPLLWKDIVHPGAENIAAAPQRFIFNDTVTLNMKKFSAANKHKSERKTSGVHLYYAVAGLIIMMQDSLR